MAQKPLQVVGGRISEVEANVTSAGAGDSGKLPALDGSGRLDISFMPVGVTAEVTVVPASENLSAGDFVNIWNNAGAANARKADATAVGKEAIGFVLSAVTSGQNATVFHEGADTSLTGLTAGSRYYLSTTPGAATTTPPDAAGNVLQFLGTAVSTTKLVYEGEEGIIQA